MEKELRDMSKFKEMYSKIGNKAFLKEKNSNINSNINKVNNENANTNNNIFNNIYPDDNKTVNNLISQNAVDGIIFNYIT